MGMTGVSAATTISGYIGIRYPSINMAGLISSLCEAFDNAVLLHDIDLLDKDFKSFKVLQTDDDLTVYVKIKDKKYDRILEIFLEEDRDTWRVSSIDCMDDSGGWVFTR